MLLPDGGSVAAVCLVVEHGVSLRVLAGGPRSADYDVVVGGEGWGVQLVVHAHVVAGSLYFRVVAVANDEGSVGIRVGQIVAACLVGKGVGVKCYAVPSHGGQPHSGVADVERLKLAPLVACRKNQGPAMLPLQFPPVVVLAVRLCVDDGFVPLLVLHDYGI